MKKISILTIILSSIMIISFSNCTKQSDTDKKTFTITNNNVNFRRDADLRSQVLGQLNHGDQVIVIQKADKKEKIGQWENYWYKIQTQKGIEGWVFGQFIKKIN